MAGTVCSLTQQFMKRWILCVAPMLALAAGCAHRTAKVEEPEPVAEPYPYHKPLSTPGMRFSSMPQVVQNTVLAEAGTAEIADVSKLDHDGQVVYKISFKVGGPLPPLYVASDGSVLNPDMTLAVAAPPGPTTIKFEDLPLAATRVVEEKAPDAEIKVINVETWGDHTIYVVSFKDDLHYPKLYVVADGTLLQQARPVTK